MPTIAILLDPELLANPDADLRYLLPDFLVDHGRGLVTDEAYDSLDDHRMVVCLGAADLDAALPVVLDGLARADVLGNSFASAIVAVTAIDPADEPRDFVVVHPADAPTTFPWP